MASLLSPRAPLWCCPFRPFFLLTAAHGALAMAAWIAFLSGLLPLPDVAGGAVVWHAHEMLFGFAMASIVGFLLTAVPEFTGTKCRPELLAPALLDVLAHPEAQAEAMCLTMERLGRGQEAPGLRAARAVLDGIAAKGTAQTFI